MEPFLGQVQTFCFNFAPRGWALCDGQLLPIAQNTALFSLVGTVFGGDGRTTFALPDLRGRSVVHVGSGPGLDHISWGQRGGFYEQVITTAEMPSHNHIATLHAATAQATEKNPKNNMLATPATSGTDTNPIYAPPTATQKDMWYQCVTVNNTGAGMPFNIRNPYLGMYVAVATTGIYPSRT